MSRLLSTLKPSASSQESGLEVEEVFEEGGPSVARGLFGVQVMANGTPDVAVSELPFPVRRGGLVSSNPQKSAATSERHIQTDVSPHLVVDSGGQLFEVRGQLMPPKQAVILPAHAGGQRWRVRGGMVKYTEYYQLLPSGSESTIHEFELDDEIVNLRQGWIALELRGHMVPLVKGATSAPLIDDYFVLEQAPKIVGIPELVSDYTFAATSPIVASCTFGYIPLAYVASPGVIRPLPVLWLARAPLDVVDLGIIQPSRDFAYPSDVGYLPPPP